MISNDPLPFQKPNFPGRYEYLFTTQKGTRYQVLFGRKTQEMFKFTIIFGVLNEEFSGNEYCETNRFEIRPVITTVLAIIADFIKQHPHIKTIEFMGQPKADPRKINQRNLLFIRYLKRTPWNVFYDEKQQKVSLVFRPV